MKIKEKRREIALNFRKKIIKGLLTLSMVSSVFLISDYLHPQEAHALGGAVDVRKNYGDRVGMETPSPVSIEFTPNASQYSYYARGDTPKNIFYEENYKGRFLWYSMVPRQGATVYQAYMARMKENLQQSVGTRQYEIDNYATHSSSNSFRYNLKTGSDSPWDSDGRSDGYNTGTQEVTSGPFAGKYYEWRYLGYSSEGNPISNPYFPDDYPASDNSDNYWKNRNWVVKSWNDGFANFEPTVWDYPGNKAKKVEWFNKYFKPAHPELFTNGRDASWWADRLSMRNDPTLSTGIVEGWHNKGGLFYKNFVMDSPKRPNLRLTNFTITDQETDDVIGKATRNTTDPYDGKLSVSTNNEKYIEKGKTYTIFGTIKNMKEPGLPAHNTTYKPVDIELIVGYDETVRKYNEVDEVYSCEPTSPTTSIKYNTSQDFACSFKVPEDFQKEIEIGFRIPEGFFLKGDNANNEDDISQIIFEPSPNDMAIKKTIDFIDQDGNETDTVIPNQTYDVRFYVSRPAGKTPVGAIGNAKNPFTTLDVRATDKGTINVKREVVSTEVLKKGKTIEILVNDIIAPKTNVIEACAKINDIHVKKGQNILNGNDGEVCRTIQSDINISVKDFVVKPQVLYLPTGLTTSYQTVKFDFMVTNYNEEKHSKDIPYVIKKGTTIIKQGTLPNVPANYPIFHSVSIDNIPLSAGNHGFTIEVNPQPRKWLESVKGVTNPYLDNVATNSILVVKPPAVVKCDVVNTQNLWTTTYSIFEWWGYEDSYWVEGYWNYDWNGKQTYYTSGYRHYYCVTTATKSSKLTINHFENYEITNVFFRSKLTEDNEGGWIDIKNGKTGKVKAGYGFEIKIVAKFTTNINTAPKPWVSGCSGKSVDPVVGDVKATERITVTMPFKDMGGKNVKYTLNANTSGAWYNETQNYEMPMRDAFGLKQTREIYVNEKAKDGTHQIKIETDGNFMGSYDKPYTKHLCDAVTVNIQIIGANTDDLKTHITQ